MGACYRDTSRSAVARLYNEPERSSFLNFQPFRVLLKSNNLESYLRWSVGDIWCRNYRDIHKYSLFQETVYLKAFHARWWLKISFRSDKMTKEAVIVHRSRLYVPEVYVVNCLAYDAVQRKLSVGRRIADTRYVPSALSTAVFFLLGTRGTDLSENSDVSNCM